MQVGDWIKLKGKTRHGKNRVHEHGPNWLIEEVRQGAMMLRSENNTFKAGTFGPWVPDGRWVELSNDKNFEWEKIDGPA